MDPNTKIDIVWIILCAILVSTMQAGFCALESGLVRAKNSINVAIKNLVDFCIASLVFWLVGYGVMFGPSLLGLAGTQTVHEISSDAYTMAFFLFQLVFCGTSTTIVSGAVAERMSFTGYFLAALVLAGLIYPVTGHWAWGGTEDAPGWLRAVGFHDFAGSTVVHSVGGWMALAAIMIIGPRAGRFAGKGIQGHDMPVAVLGVFLLWFGWFGFNGGSELAFNERVPLILVNTAMGGAAGGLAALLFTWLVFRLPQVPLIMNGVIAGLVGVTAGCDHFTPFASVIAGAIAGILACLTSVAMDRTHLDDAVGAVAAHLIPGIWGTLAVAVVGDPDGWPMAHDRWQQLLIQLQGVATMGAYAFIVSYSLLWLINKVHPLRVTEQQERMGLNISEHGASTSTQDLLTQMIDHERGGDFSQGVQVEPETEAEPIAREYNRVLAKVNEMTQDLKESERRVSTILESSAFPIAILDLDTHQLNYLNGRALEMFALLPGQALDEERLWVDEGERAMVLHTAAAMGKVTDVEVQLRNAKGQAFYALLSASRMRLDEHECLCLSFNDITSRKAVEAMLKQRATHDSLTGAANPAHFAELADREIRRSRRFGLGLSVLMLDADHFKAVNDTYGHEAGDRVLQELVQIIRLCLRSIDVVGRMGGEEFAILLAETDHDGARTAAERMCEAIARHPVALPDGEMLHITVSIGMAVLHSGDANYKTLLRRADQALYRAKAHGRNRVEQETIAS
ncbi:diguanylate cyclase [Pokkaliibacter plantistimulans]|uniref:Ammonium transporter n=1 Tax=Proteobacteria bacterium 228 TaxID=2083153 RepID=A0A2S5KTB7_9PROT|nr:ammonium transporter [Pokkaliibacter plantistimulans]PPC78097.1 diguanylate cyclase [Pokkaliibacter plantistimulans]